jgi:GTP-binding protein
MPFEPAEIERGRLLFAAECEFVAGADTEERIPKFRLPEIAFAGRSNVGKSSLINALTNRKTLARVSHTPGRTQQINFFDLGGRLTLVDLPGYGYAEVSKEKKQNWGQLIRDYLRGRANLAAVCLLIDGRHGLKPLDHEIMDLLDNSAVSTRVILTKEDKLGKTDRSVIDSTVEGLKRHTAAFPEVMLTSSHDGLGIEDVRAMLAGFAKA